MINPYYDETLDIIRVCWCGPPTTAVDDDVGFRQA